MSRIYPHLFVVPKKSSLKKPKHQLTEIRNKLKDAGEFRSDSPIPTIVSIFDAIDIHRSKNSVKINENSNKECDPNHQKICKGNVFKLLIFRLKFLEPEEICVKIESNESSLIKENTSNEFFSGKCISKN